MYRLPFELTDSAKLLHFTILGGGSADPPAPLNDATGVFDVVDMRVSVWACGGGGCVVHVVSASGAC